MAENTNDRLIEAARAYAAADTLGLTEDELMKAVNRKVAADRRDGLSTTTSDVLSEFEDAALAASNTSEGIRHKGEFVDLGNIDDQLLRPDMMGAEQDEFFVGERQFDQNRKSPARFRADVDADTGERRLIALGRGATGGWRDLGVERAGRVESGRIAWDDLSDSEQFNLKENRERAVSGLPGVKDALRELRMGSNLYGYDAFPARTEAEVQGWRDSGLIPPNADYGSPLRSLASVESSLADSVEYGAEQRAVERAAVRDLVDIDNIPFDENLAIELQRRGQTPQALADKLANDEFGRRVSQLTSVENAAARVAPRSAAEQSVIDSIGGINIGNIASGGAQLQSMGDIQDLGQVKSKEEASVVRRPDPTKMGTAVWQNVPGGNQDTGYWVDSRSGEILSYGEPEVVKPAEVNLPTSDQNLNSPSQPAVDWMQEGRVDTNTGGGLNFGNDRQADITGITGDFSNRLRGLSQKRTRSGQLVFPLLGKVSNRINTAEEVVRVSDYIIKQHLAAGGKFYSKDLDPVTRKKSVVVNPGIAEVMNYLNMSSTEEDMLKSALFAMDRAQPSLAKQRYMERGGAPNRRRADAPHVTGGVIFNSPEAIDSSQGVAEVAMVPKGKKAGSGRDLRGVLRRADSPDARKPFIGATADEGEADVTRKRAGGLDPVELRWQAEQRAGRNQKLAKGAKGELTTEQIRRLRGFQEDNAKLTSEEIARRQAAGESTEFLTRKGRQGRPLPQRIWTTKDMAFDPSLRVGDIETRNRSDRAKAEVAILGELMQQPVSTRLAEKRADLVTGPGQTTRSLYQRPATSVSPAGGRTSTPPPTPPEPRVEAPTPSIGRPAPWHRGKKGNILGGLGIAGAAALGYVGGGMARDAWIENEAAARAAQ